MSPERWNQLRSLYDLALDHAPAERLKVLSSQAGTDTALVDEVLRMIELDEGAGDFLEDSPAKQLRQQLAEPTPLFEPGESVAQRFNVIRLIGSGGMGEVYEAEDTDLGERVALKTLRVDRIADPKAHQRLRREALLARKITHPNVCRIYDILRHQRAGEEFSENFAVLSMEFLSGITLADHLKQHGPFTAAAAEPIIRQILSALIAAHQAGVIHRDLKPSNIMLVEGRAVVTDFGLAITGPTSSTAPLTTLTHSGQLIGTLEYMAPEQIRNQPVTPQSDIYSLGVVIYEMLTGQRPTQGATGLEEILNRVLEAPPSPRAINPAIPRRWEAIILRCLDRDPLCRYPSAHALLEALDSRWQLPRFRPSRRAMLLSATSVAAIGVGTRFWNRPQFLGAKLILTAVENRTNDRDLDNVGTMLEHQLSQSARLQIPNARRMEQLRQQLGLAKDARPSASNYREMALREGASGAIFTSLVANGSEYELHIRLEETANTPLRPARTWSKDFQAPSKKDLFARIDDAARWLRQQSGETISEISRFDRPAEDTTTNSWEAWRLYAESKNIALQGKWNAAIKILEEATRLDPKFAMAWRDTADYQLRIHDYNNGFQTWQKALSALDARKNSSIEALRIRGMYFEDTAQHKAAEQVYRTLLALLPTDYRANVYLGTVLERQRKFEEARAVFENTLQIYPERTSIYSHLVPLYLLFGDFSSAEHGSEKLRSSNQPGWAAYCDYMIAMTRANYSAANSSATTLSNTSESMWQIRGPLVLASLHGYLGDYKRSLAAVDLALSRSYKEAASDWMDRLPVWKLFLQLKSSQQNHAAYVSDWFALQRKNRSAPATLDHALVGHILNISAATKRPSPWPSLPAFDLMNRQLQVLDSPTKETAHSLLGLAASASPEMARDACEFAHALCEHYRWPTTSIRFALSQGKPNYWLANEFYLPGRIQINQ